MISKKISEAKEMVLGVEDCGHAENADVNASKNILERFLTGPYGAGCKPIMGRLST